MDTRWQRVNWGKGNERQRTSESNWAQPMAWDKEAAAIGQRARVFCASLADVFDAEVPLQWRADLFDLIRKTQHLDWLLLTKRIHEAVENIAFSNLCSDRALTWPADVPVWLGFSAEDQERYNDRIEALYDNPAPIGFLSCESLLGPIDLRLDHQDNRKACELGNCRRRKRTERASDEARLGQVYSGPMYFRCYAFLYEANGGCHKGAAATNP